MPYDKPMPRALLKLEFTAKKALQTRNMNNKEVEANVSDHPSVGFLSELEKRDKITNGGPDYLRILALIKAGGFGSILLLPIVG